MAVIIKYVVERNGEEKMTFTSKADADAYDKMLDMADELFALLGDCEQVADEQQREELSLFLANHRDDVLHALGAKRKVSKEKSAVKPAIQRENEINANDDAKDDDQASNNAA